METKHDCPTCQTAIPENAPGGFCPACILRDADEAPVFGPAAPSLAEISAAFPQLQEISLIGQGGMGFVYKARQPGLDRTIALKILSPVLSGDPAFAERFAREARTLGKLQHPNIVSVFEHGECGGFFYLMMEYVDGVNLRQAMRAGRFTPAQALAIVPGICDALQTAHEQGVWHRDIKPENILLDREGKVKIADFGIARIVGDPHRDFTLTMTGNALGSVAYMAPEQHEKPHEVDHRADIYSLGVVIYEMLTGELPLGRFPSPSQRAAVDSRIDEIVLQTLEKEREYRQQSATEVKTDINRALRPEESRTDRSEKLIAPQQSGFEKLAFALFLTGVLGTPLLMAFTLRDDIPIIFGAVAVLLAFILGLMSRRKLLGRLTVYLSFILLVIGLFPVFLKSGVLPKVAPSAQVQVDPPEEPAVDPFSELFQYESPTPIPTTESSPPIPSDSVEEVFRKANAAANASNGEELEMHVRTYDIRADLIATSNRNRNLNEIRIIHHTDPLEMMELFYGEIIGLKVVSIENERLPSRVFGDYLGMEGNSPVVYATIRKSNGALRWLCVRFTRSDNRWIGERVWLPNYGAYSRIEFKPDKDGATILKTHLGVNTDFRAVSGEPGLFDIYGFDKDADTARTNADKRVQELRESLEPFGLDKYLKVVSPAEKPEIPYLGENEPLFQPEEP